LKISGLEKIPPGAYQVLLRNEDSAERLVGLVWR
jgi:hypothetical protein